MVTFKENLDLLTAWSLIETRVRPLDELEQIDLLSFEGYQTRILGVDVLSRRNLPQYPASAVDGFALKASDTANASPRTPARIPEGSYGWVNTGGGVDRAFDSVVMVEDTSMDGSALLVAKMTTKGENIRPEGEDVTKGQVIARRGDPLDAFLIPLLIASGYSTASVPRLPRTIFIPTGDEIIPAAEWVRGDGGEWGRVPETNSYMLKKLFQDWGFPLEIHGLVRDDEGLIREAALKSLEVYDLVIIGAGTAKGKRDHSAEVIEKLSDPLFRGVRMKPGRPVIAGVRGNKPLVALPGFPMSALVTCWSIINPLLKRLYGETSAPAPEEAVGSAETLNTKFLLHHSSQPGVLEWLRIKCGEIDGTIYSWPLPAGASSTFSIADADGFAILAPSTLEVPKGSDIRILLRKKVDLKKRIVYQGSNDPAIERIVSYVRKRGGDLAIRSVGSLGGLSALARGEGHVASCHLLDPEKGVYNDSYIERLDETRSWRRIKLFKRQQGFLVRKGNPAGIHSVKDLAVTGAFFVNRQPGAGTRVLFDHLLKEAGIDPGLINGYDNIAITHYEAAARIPGGSAVATLGVKAAAEAFGTDFIPVTEEDFELVIPERFIDHPGILILLEALSDERWRSEVDSLGGYRWIS
ncbi:MAG: Molybdopterin molybdenumtransferase [Synergistetes bacterium ADurb.Bin155]|nr:molybdopterin biosynthesis protein MoeA [Synergistales bacterium]OQB46001.1 MAG: Molybdopterin molybdenumtransferase [Synergistetes bacterium ADurb.Bin155]